jgi:hypothetical protein
MWGPEDLKKTRAHQEAREEAQKEILSIAVPAPLDRGMTVEKIAQHYKPVETVQRFTPRT